MPANLLLQPGQAGAIATPNRVVMAPLTRSRATEQDRTPGPLAARYYAQRSSAGFIVSEATQVTPQGVGYPGTPGIHSDAQVEGWRTITEAVHAAGGRILCQLWHVGRVAHSSFLAGQQPVAPSAIAAKGETFTLLGMKPFELPRALEASELPGLVAAYRHGAEFAKAAGFDGVEVHGANGYLLDQFLQDGTNQRTDAYGGSPENRARLLLEVTEAAIAVWGAERVGVRLSPGGTFGDMSDSDPTATFLTATRALAPFGLAYLHVIRPLDAGGGVKTAFQPLLRELRQAFPGPYVLAAGFDQTSAEAALAAGEADLIAFGKAFLANPDLPERFRLRAPLNAPDPATFYGGDAKGYTDYPELSEAA